MTALFLGILAVYGFYRGAKSIGKILKRAREAQEEAQRTIEEYGRGDNNND